uniref:Uncharacterized protein n=1 Tax=Schistosoma mansoni TaxID=6183 RepID=A0AA82MCT4_SCHMA
MAGSECTRNSIRHHVYALSKMFGVDLTYDSNVYAFADSLEKSIGSSTDTQYNIHDLVARLCNDNPQAGAVLRRYEELKPRNIRELSAVVYLLSRLKSDDVVLRSLEHLSLPTKPLNGQSKVSTVSVCGKVSSHLIMYFAQFFLTNDIGLVVIDS